ncbi:MAG: SRPBCC family protein [Phycisphaerales bacterium]
MDHAPPRRVSADCRCETVVLELEIAAPPTKVWKAITTDLGKWWLPDFHCAPGSKGIRMEPKPGGRVFETDGKGGGLLWYSITALQKGKSITMVGHFGPPFGGPVTSLLTWSLAKSDRGTRFTLADYLFGVVSPALVQQVESGWRRLFEEGMRQYVERKPRRSRA